jgi:single-stranded DNA-binding protein
MNDIRRAVFTGRLVKDAQTNQGETVMWFSIGCNGRDRVDGEWTDVSYFFDIKSFSKGAIALAKAGAFSKGRQVSIDARVVQEKFTDQHGNARAAVRFIADEVVPLGPKAENANGSTSDIPVDANDFAAAPAGGSSGDDDIPF